ncbi:MAG TPA: hypothetical protein VGX28_11505 [Frankiaceae bacterium]|nr:hypothetical protein [Frankiaceae bacterium]
MDRPHRAGPAGRPARRCPGRPPAAPPPAPAAPRAPVAPAAPARRGRVPNLSGQPWRLQRRFQKLGDLRRRTPDEITAATGRPSAVSAAVAGTLVRWRAIASTGYHIALELDADERCLGVTFESSV